MTDDCPGDQALTWSWRQARDAAGRLRAAPLGSTAAATVRPRGVVGLVRSRAPLPILLFVAAQDGLVVDQNDGGFAVLQRPAAARPVRAGGYGLRLLRWIDRRWDFVVFAAPPAAGLVLAMPASLATGSRAVGTVLVLMASVWVLVLLLGMLVYQLRWVASIGTRSGLTGSRPAESLPAYHWSVPLLHQPDPASVEDLVSRVRRRLVSLIRTDLDALARHQARVDPEVTETAVVLMRGISTESARRIVAASLQALGPTPPDAEVVLLESSGRLEALPHWPAIGGGFFLWYVVGLAVVIAVCAVFVADTEAQDCAPSSCAGRPTTYPVALRWLLQRLVFLDGSGVVPGTTRVVFLGWLVSVAGAMGVLVAIVAARQEIARNREMRSEHHDALVAAIGRSRVLILVVKAGEREAVLESMRSRTGRGAHLEHDGEQTVYRLGRLAGAELMLAQAGEQGAGAAGMHATAQAAIARCRPDYVILTGICYGLRPDEGQQLGDVVIARRVQNMDHGKVIEHDGGTTFINRGVNVGTSPALLDRFHAGQSTWPDQRARVHIGTVLTSNVVVASASVVLALRRNFPDAIAGEMEGIAVYNATTRGTKPDWIVVKGISDWGYDKTDRHQPVAARNAADFVVHVVAGGGLDERRPVSG